MSKLAQQLADAKAEGWAEWIQTAADEQAVRDGCRFDIKAAERVQAFFRKFLRHSLDGTIEDSSFFTLIAAAEDDDDWTDPTVWKKANPSFGVTIGTDQFAEDCREAQESPARENSFRRYRLNQWTEQDVRWLSM